MSVNETQVGGTHYQSSYQHWDFVIDTNLHYLYGCATKYLSRWRQKNGVQDLEKAIHYIRKAQEAGVAIYKTVKTAKAFERFVVTNVPGGANNVEAWPFFSIYEGDLELAIRQIEGMIADAKDAAMLANKAKSEG
jgi:Protein of unknwon function (DUF3310)